MGKEQGHEQIERRERTPEFERYSSLVKKEEWRTLKKELFGEKTTEANEQPHGIDLAVENIFLAGEETSPAQKLEWEKQPAEKESDAASIRLSPGKTYIFLLTPHLKPGKEITRLPYRARLFSGSSLFRIGIAAKSSLFSGDALDNPEIQEFSSDYREGRQAAFRITILNPNGAVIEKNAPVVQMVFEKSPGNAFLRLAEEQERFAETHAHEKEEELHLGDAFIFSGQTPRLGKTKEHDKINVTAPLVDEGVTYFLKSGMPYLLRTEETVTFLVDQFGTTHGSIPEARVYCDSVIDAGYQGKLTYLVIPKKDMMLKPGDTIAAILRDHVPGTKEPYRGKW